MNLEYTPEQKDRLEIEKLHAEVAELRSWVRRWLSAAGGLIGVITAAISIVVASNQIKSSSQQAETKLQQADARLAQAERLEKQRLALEATATLLEITRETDAKSKELARKKTELTAIEKQLGDVTSNLKDAEERARALALAAPKAGSFSSKALDLIVDIHGIEQPSLWYGNYFIEIGVRYRLDVAKKEDFRTDWKDHLPLEHVVRLEEAVGVTGSQAKDLAAGFEDIKISRDAAVKVFERVTLPQYQAKAAQAFPGYQTLPLDAQGVLVGLVFERGPSLEGDLDKEMRAIRDLIPSGDLRAIAAQIRAMKRAYEGKGFDDGLIRHYEDAAKLVESATK